MTAGFARRYGVNVLVARVAAIVGVLVLTPLLYLPLWVLMPTDATCDLSRRGRPQGGLGGASAVRGATLPES